MIVHATAAACYAARLTPAAAPRPATVMTNTANIAETVSISAAAREACAASTKAAATAAEPAVEARLAAIKAKDALSRTQEEQDYLRANDQRLAEITARPAGKLTADEVDYLQKALGFVNTFVNLSPAEKALYDEAVASGNSAAAEGISQIAMTRMMGHVAGGADGSTYDPLTTAITAANIVKYFSHSIIDPSGQAAARFEALIQFLQDKSSA